MQALVEYSRVHGRSHAGANADSGRSPSAHEVHQIIAWCPSHAAHAQRVAEALFLAGTGAENLTAIVGELALPATGERAAGSITIIDLAALDGPGRSPTPAEAEAVAHRMTLAAKAGGDIAYLVARPSTAGWATDDADMRRAASRFPELRLGGLTVDASLAPSEAAGFILSVVRQRG